jgi:hypothetical protein
VIGIARKPGYDRPVRRRVAVLLFAALALPALALAGHQEPKRQVNAEDERKAASIVLKRADLAAGWKKLPARAPDDSHVDCPGYQPSEADLVLTGDAESDFERSGGFPSVYSFSDIYKTTSDAQASWTRGVKRALAVCMAKLMADSIKADGAQAAILSAGRIAFPKHAPLTAAFRAVLRVSATRNGETITSRLTMHLVALQRGRGQAGLMTVGFGAGIPIADLRVFSKQLAQRLAAAKL